MGSCGRLNGRRVIAAGLLLLAIAATASAGRAEATAGRILVAYRSGTSLVVKSPGGGAATPFASDHGRLEMSAPSLSPDGRRVLWVAIGGGDTLGGPVSQKIYLGAVDGSRPRVIFESGTFAIMSVHFAGNGSVVMVKDVGDRRAAVFFSAHPSSGFREVRSSIGLVGGNADLSPDSQSIAFNASWQTIVVAPTGPSPARSRVVLRSRDRSVRMDLLAWSRDNRLIYASSCKARKVTTTTCVYSASASGGDRRRIATFSVDTSWGFSSFAAGADGRTVAFSGCSRALRGCGVWVVTSPSARPVRIARIQDTSWGVATATQR